MCAVNGREVRVSTVLGAPGPCPLPGAGADAGCGEAGPAQPPRMPGPAPARRGAGAQACWRPHRCGGTCGQRSPRRRLTPRPGCGRQPDGWCGFGGRAHLGHGLSRVWHWGCLRDGGPPWEGLQRREAGGKRCQTPDPEATASSWTSSPGQARSCSFGHSFAHRTPLEPYCVLAGGSSHRQSPCPHLLDLIPPR